MKIREALLVLTASLTMAVVCPIFAQGGESVTMSKKEMTDLLGPLKLKPIKSKSEIPKQYWETLNLENMSEINGPFSAGCAGGAPHLRLMIGAVSEPYVCVMSESGGIAHMYQFVVLKRAKNTIDCVYNEAPLAESRREEIRKMLGG